MKRAFIDIRALQIPIDSVFAAAGLETDVSPAIHAAFVMPDFLSANRRTGSRDRSGERHHRNTLLRAIIFWSAPGDTELLAPPATSDSRKIRAAGWIET